MNTRLRLFEVYAAMLDAMADEPECDDPDARCRLLRACANGMRDAAQGHARYEALRVLKIPQFTSISRRNIAGERFDDMVDDLVRGNNESK